MSARQYAVAEMLPQRETRRRSALLGAASLMITGLMMAGLAGCHHHQYAPIANAPAPPPIQSRQPSYRPAPAPPPPSVVTADDEQYVASHKPIYSEEGVASWYGPPYHNRVGANGKVFDQNVMTAAHRTLPMGSLITVTNEKTGQSATMRVTDRGPFVQGRTLDLSMASAKATGVYRAGLATVRVDVYEAPRSIDVGGRWCVQIGAFEHEGKAVKLHEQLEREYNTAQVIDFSGPTGYWVRIRPAGDNRESAEMLAKRIRPVEGDAYLVRLD
ncbi:septal ring lytic transglycosylase RlpA family protein [Acidicapsa ligni]|uniref:septal ring lytic transglycosylase RlpA family protein n=1 Tax=Acidicapsa ligni TaxID=542300 RepID=UPI0021E0F5AF|nr:septal ring lytic transglycosylase RlpA family protein [Acidicapsa ligni]